MTKDELVMLVGDLSSTLLSDKSDDLPELNQLRVIMCVVMAGLTDQSQIALDSLYVVASTLLITPTLEP